MTTQSKGNTAIDTEWDLEIISKPTLFEFNFNEVWRYKDLLWLFVRRDFVAQYKQTILGPIWHLVQPIMTTLMFLLIFGKIANVPTDGIEPVLFYMSGVTVWNFFSLSLTATSSTFITNSHIFGKVYFPRVIMPLSTIISGMIRFVIQFLLLVVAMIWFSLHGSSTLFHWQIVLVPVVLIIMGGMALGLGFLISAITTKYRDFTVFLTFAVQLLMYATPITYPLSLLGQSKYSWLIKVNPLTPLVEFFRFSLFGTGTFTLMELIYSLCFMITSILTGLVLFNRVEKTFMDTV